MKYTKGNWKADKYCSSVTTDYESTTKRTYGYGCGNNFICCLNDGEYHEYMDDEEQKANVQLIAAAPDLLEALKTVLEHWVYSKCGYTDSNAENGVDLAEKAIKKAEGNK